MCEEQVGDFAIGFRRTVVVATKTPSSPAFQVRRVSTQRPGWRWLGYLCAGLALVLAGYFAGGQQGTSSLSLAPSGEGLEEQVERLQTDNLALASRLAIAERAAQVTDDASEQVRQQLIVQRDELQSLQSELDFYRSIVSERAGAPGPRVRDFRIREDASGGARFELILVRGQPDGKAVRGRVEIRLLPEGADTGDLEVLYAASAAVATAKFSFDFFQRLSGPIEAEGHAGEALLTLLPDGKGAKPVHAHRSWPGGS